MLKKLMKIMMGVVLCAGLFMAMPKSVEALDPPPHMVLVPGNPTSDSGSGWTWVGGTTKTLTITNANIYSDTANPAVTVPGGSTVIFVGDNTIATTQAEDCIHCPDGDLTIKFETGATATLTCNGGTAVYADGDITIEGNGTLNISAKMRGIWADSGVRNINISCKELNITYTGGGSSYNAICAYNVVIGQVEKLVASYQNGGQAISASNSLTMPSSVMVTAGTTNGGSDKVNNLPFDASVKTKLLDSDTKYVRIVDPTKIGGSSSGSSSSKEEAKKESPTQKFTNNAVKTAKASGTIDATGGWKSFDRGTLKELSKADRDITIYFDHDTHTYSVTVPKGFDPEKLLNEEGYCGFQYLVKVYGAKVVGRIAK